jgi:predicted nucleic acid-binding Zn ribbon protein
MPTYVYKGHNTGQTFEIHQRITAPALTHHPETGEPVFRVIQQAGVVFKGSGFYKTDSRPAPSGEGGGGKASSSSSSSSSSTTSSSDTASSSTSSTSKSSGE